MKLKMNFIKLKAPEAQHNENLKFRFLQQKPLGFLNLIIYVA